MIDRLPELRINAGYTAASMSDDGLENRHYEDDGKQEGIDEEFIQHIKAVREMIAGLKNNNQRINSIKAKYAKAIKSAQQKQNSDEMNQILNENVSYQQKIRDNLANIEKKVKQAEKTQPEEPETRMKKNFYINLNKEVGEVLQKQQNFEEEYKKMVKEKVTRQVRIIDKELTEQDLQEYVNNPGLAQEMLQKKIYGQASVTLKNTVSDIQDKFRDIQRLDASVKQCLALFNELSALVFAQGEKIDSIEANVVDCKDYITKADEHLTKAKEHHKCSKKCMCIALILGLVIIIIVVIVVVSTKSG